MSTTTTSSQSGSPGSDILCAPTGFIYPSYRAARTETHVDKPPLKGSHQPSAYVSSSVGGSVSTLSFEDTKTKYIQDILARCHHHVTFDLRTKKTSD
jgi:hypothetical protein